MPTYNPVSVAFDTFKRAIHEDSGMAWGWQRNIAMSIMDSTGISHKSANCAAAHLMSHIFDYDITRDPHYLDTQITEDTLVDMLINLTQKETSDDDTAFLIETLMPSLERGDLDEVTMIASLLK